MVKIANGCQKRQEEMDKKTRPDTRLSKSRACLVLWLVGWLTFWLLVILMNGDGVMGGLGGWLVYFLVVGDFDAQ